MRTARDHLKIWISPRFISSAAALKFCALHNRSSGRLESAHFRFG
jgi:hypothetical protein